MKRFEDLSLLHLGLLALVVTAALYVVSLIHEHSACECQEAP